MTNDTVKQALRDLFPDPEPVVEEPVVEAQQEGEADEKAKKPTPKKEEPRINGVIERDHAEYGYDIDVQCDPGELLAAVMILDTAGFFIESITGVDWIKEGQLEIIYDENYAVLKIQLLYVP